MTAPDRLTPPQLRDLADLLDDPRGKQLPFHVFFRQEAARREADAKPVKISQPECHEPGGCIAPVACVQFGKCPQKPEAAPQGEREGPGSAAAPDDDFVGRASLAAMEAQSKDKPAPAADDLVPTYDELGRIADSRKVIIEKLERQILRLVDEREAADEKARRCAVASLQWENRTRIAEKDWAEAKALNMTFTVQREDAERELAEAQATVEAQAREIAMWHAGANAATERANRNADERDAEKARADRMADYLRYLDRRGGMGIETHEEIRALLAEGGDRG